MHTRARHVTCFVRAVPPTRLLARIFGAMFAVPESLHAAAASPPGGDDAERAHKIRQAASAKAVNAQKPMLSAAKYRASMFISVAAAVALAAAVAVISGTVFAVAAHEPTPWDGWLPAWPLAKPPPTPQSWW